MNFAPAALLRSPATVGLFSYVSAALLGSLLLSAPFCSRGEGLAFVDAIFLSTSAICVTGLTPVASLHEVLNDTGWWVLLALIQCGGVGLVLFGVLAVRLLGKRVSVIHAEALRDSYADPSITVRLLRRVLLTTLAFEFAGAVLLYPAFRDGPQPVARSVFHAVSAFCNAGFSSVPGGMVVFQRSWLCNVVLMVLIVSGGLGFRVISESLRAISPFSGKTRFSLHSRIVLLTTTVFLLLGFFSFVLLEWNSTAFAHLRFGERILASMFQSVTTRTAGFNTVEIADLNTPSLLWTCFFMVVGGSPGSTAGGLKTMTFALLMAGFLAHIRGHQEVVVHGRTLARLELRKALAIAVVYALTLLSVVMALTIVAEVPGPRSFLSILFESCSALGTVGLSMGITADLPGLGKMLLALTMLLGRIGPLTLVLMVPRLESAPKIQYPQEAVGLG